MKKLHIANTNFELTYEKGITSDLQNSFFMHPSFLQLQFLPLLYANPEDSVLVTTIPSQDYLKQIALLRGDLPKMILMSEVIQEDYTIEPWAHNHLIQDWAKKKNIDYRPPSKVVMQELASKKFTFDYAPKLKNATLIRSPLDIKWDSLPIVLKSDFGFSGLGNTILHKKEDIKETPFLRIQEPWVKVVTNFSSQYLVTENEIVCLGRTQIQNTERGSYLATKVGPLNIPKSFIEKHDLESRLLLTRAQKMGFRGNAGIDAFTYKDNCQIALHPIVELNPRKTMSWFALCLLKNKEGSISLTKEIDSTLNLLPRQLNCKHKTFQFTRGLIISDGRALENQRGNSS
jgi:hypothetical protein